MNSFFILFCRLGWISWFLFPYCRIKVYFDTAICFYTILYCSHFPKFVLRVISPKIVRRVSWSRFVHYHNKKRVSPCNYDPLMSDPEKKFITQYYKVVKRPWYLYRVPRFLSGLCISGYILLREHHIVIMYKTRPRLFYYLFLNLLWQNLWLNSFWVAQETVGGLLHYHRWNKLPPFCYSMIILCHVIRVTVVYAMNTSVRLIHRKPNH